MAAKAKKTKEDIHAIEKAIRDAAPPETMTIPINLRGVYGSFENFYAVINKKGLVYIVGKDKQTIEMETYKALNPRHMAFNQQTLVDTYNLYS